MTITTHRRALLGGALTAPFLGRAARAQGDWRPDRPIRFIVAFAAGGAADTAARSIAADMQEALGQNIIIENRTGGNAVVAAAATLQSPRDGYTFLVDAANQLTNPALMRDLPFDYRTAFIPVTQISSFPQVVAVKDDFPARTLQEFIAAAKARPSTISIGTPPAAGMAHLALAALEQKAGIQLLHSPYRGGADAARDIMSGSIDAVLITTSSVRPPVQAGKARVLAVTSLERIPSLPNVPTIAESGFPGYDMNDWNGLFAGAGTPRAAIERIAAVAAVSARAPAVRARMDPAGAIMIGNSPAAFATWLDQQRSVAVQVIRDAGITLG
ncbi:Bug family tripartite tricarboxylate transporter substrate binding protein [Plastoroseomonas hellenica]|uniref:Bug family tripartite tricarboxylate transporter substrate binding protein n=1 Tax=Plastoroseomonas hellenica TaxID=2687306 RepID=UPI001BABB41D|nr:tripartite tricarboxylate transporter substrate-binding protein [Plastoroseomonas hellenica]MBR0644025.1 twin-arginine translocation pathway signal protein [Plastoroseomonas hellenica]